jgi:hypothetical protein
LRQTVIEVRASSSTQSAVPPSAIVDANGIRDKLVWSAGRPPSVDLPDLSWPDLLGKVGVLAFASFAAALGADQPRTAFVRQFYGALREAQVPVATAVSIVWEVERLLGGTGESDPAAAHGKEDLASFLQFVGLPQADAIARGWLGLSASTQRVGATRNNDNGIGISADDLEVLLDVLDPSDFASYDAWRDMLFAAHSATAGSEAGREIFVDWSARNPDYSELDWSDKVRATWRRAKSSRANKIGIGTLLRQIIDAGHGDLVRQVMRKYDSVEDNQRMSDAPIQELDRSQLDAAPILDRLPGTEGI